MILREWSLLRITNAEMEKKVDHREQVRELLSTTIMFEIIVVFLPRIYE